MPGQNLSLIHISLVLALAAGGAYASRPAELRYIQLSVGQADSALLLDGNQTLLIDAGSDGESALDYLLAEGRDIDALFITHLHLDHIGGVADLLDACLLYTSSAWRCAFFPPSA